MCVPLSNHHSSACMCVHVREHTCDVDKDEPMCSAKFECSLRVCVNVNANVYVIVYDYEDKRKMVSDACKTLCL